MTQPIEKNGAGDGARTRDLRRDRPEGPLVVSTPCSENKAPECAKVSERATLAGLAMLALAGCGEDSGALRKDFRQFSEICIKAGGLPSWTGGGSMLCNNPSCSSPSPALPIPSERVM